MIRRLQIACVGLGVFLIPACTGNRLSDPYYTGGGQGYVLMNRPGVPPGMYQRQAQNPGGQFRQDTAAANQKFGPIQVREQQQQPIETANEPNINPAQHIVPAPERSVGGEPTASVESLLSDPNQRPKIAVDPVDPVIEPRVDVNQPKDLKAPDWPNLGGKNPMPHSLGTPQKLPNLDAPAVKERTPTTMAPVEPLPPMNSGTSLKVIDPPPVVGAAAITASSDETMLIRAIKAFQSNRPDEAVDYLKRLDSTNQEVLLYLMPIMVRLGEGSLNAMTPDELAMLIDRLQTATGMLRSKASLRIDRAMFCRGVRKFADVDAYEPRHEFRSGDMVFLYAELKNFTCEENPNKRPGAKAGEKSAGFAIRLGATLELRDARNGLVWRTDLSKNDFAQTPPQDYYHTYRFCVPDKLPPGVYTLWLTVIDKPSNRAIRKPIEMRVGHG